MGRTVRDAAILLTAMTGTDPNDSATATAETHHDYSSNLTADALNGKRIGVIRSWYGAGSDQRVEDIYQASIDKIQAAGAVIIDDINIDIATAEEGWNLIGTFFLSSGPVKVELSNETDGKMVVADAVKWVKAE